jgi:Sigma-70, region 4
LWAEAGTYVREAYRRWLPLFPDLPAVIALSAYGACGLRQVRMAERRRLSATELRPALEALAALLGVEVKEALQALPEEFRTTVYYADVEGLAYREVAEVTGATIGTVMSRLYRGRGQLRDPLAGVSWDLRRGRRHVDDTMVHAMLHAWLHVTGRSAKKGSDHATKQWYDAINRLSPGGASAIRSTSYGDRIARRSV